MMKSEIDLRSSYIVELPGNVVKLIAQLIHIHLVGYPNSTTANSALDILCEQTSVVQRDPRRHQVYPSELGSDKRSVPSPSVYHIPVK